MGSVVTSLTCMSLRDLTDPGAVTLALDEFDQLGREAFLDKYGFGKAKGYFLVRDGIEYDSKAIASAAHAYQHGQPILRADLRGGDASVAPKLTKLGFEIISPGKLPNWSADERMLALDLYLRTRGVIGYGPSAKEVIELSRELRSLRIFPDEIRLNPTFRNPNGTALKLHNFESIDPAHEGVGMPNLSVGDMATWDEWAHRPEVLAAAVALIRARGVGDDVLDDTGEDDEYEAAEGRILYREHRRYERDRKLVAAKKKDALKRTGKLACEVCAFESLSIYDIDGVIDVHHIKPLHTIGESVTKLSDLALVCPTCHRVIHRHKPFITPKELRAKAAHQAKISPVGRGFHGRTTADVHDDNARMKRNSSAAVAQRYDQF